MKKKLQRYKEICESVKEKKKTIRNFVAKGDKGTGFFNDQVNKQPRQKRVRSKKHRLQQDKKLCEAVQAEEKQLIQVKMSLKKEKHTIKTV